MTKLKRDYVNLNSLSFLFRKKGRKKGRGKEEERKRKRKKRGEERERERKRKEREKGEERKGKKLDEMCFVLTTAMAVNWQPCVIN